MNALSKLIITLTVCAFSIGCASSVKEKIVRNSLVAAAPGVAYGLGRDEFKTQNALMYGATSGLITALVSLYYYDPDKEIEDYKRKSKELAKSLDDFSSPLPSSYLKGYSGTTLNNPQAIPEKYRSLISPGQWTLKQIDEWESLDEYRKVHKTEMLEIIPPKFNGN
jgi:hypothetical protein